MNITSAPTLAPQAAASVACPRLSVLIPTFNYDCTLLVRALDRQAKNLAVGVEILVGDDASTHDEVAKACRSLEDGAVIRCLRPAHNLGRAAIRNLLGREARGEWVLFLDSDGLPPDSHFLARYAETMDGNADVVCGGIVHPHKQPSAAVSLRYHYERHAERSHTAARRNAAPYAAFRSFNFMIRRSIFLATPFDETLRDYGYEDVLFGHRLAEAGARVTHIDNPLLNCDIEDNATFLRKTEEALRTLAAHAPLLGPHVRLSLHLMRLRRLGLGPAVDWCFGKAECALRRHLLGRRPAVWLFNCYKLGYLNHVWPCDSTTRR